MPAARHGGATDLLRIELLGGFRVAVGSRVTADADWRLRKAAALVKLLVLAPGHRLHREQVRGLLWPDLDVAAAANNLRYALHVARRALVPPPDPPSRFLQTNGELLALAPDAPVWVDVEAFEAGVAAARRARDPAAYRAALALYAGDLLPEDRFEEWARERRESLRGLYLAALLELARLGERGGDREQAIEALRRVVEAEPTHEEAHAALMRLYARAGDRGRALRQYERLAEALRRELDVEPEPGVRRLCGQIRSGELDDAEAAPPVASGGRASGPISNLPAPLSSFVGRQREIVEVGALLRSTRLLTLTGVGGSGKTRLALQVAADAVDRFGDGVRLVELAALTDPGVVAHAVAAALGVREAAGRPIVETVGEVVGTRRLLLVLDNCEHLVGACATVANALLRGCPNLTVLATSRERLGLTGEVVWWVPPLSVDDGVRLFVERAMAVAPGLTLTEGDAAAVTEVVRRLDGLPLALELAAARVPALSIEMIAARLDDRFRLLTGGDRTALPRQQTLRATLDWSHDLLSEEERELFRRLAVFAGGFDLEAVEAIRGDDLLGRLVDRSLVLVEEEEGGRRYRLLESVRQYAGEHLARSGEEEEIRARHGDWYLRLAERLERATWGGPEQKQALDRLETERDNLRAALAWLRRRSDVTGLTRLAAALGRFWEVRGHLTEGAEQLGAALALGDGAPAIVRARALNAAGRIALAEGEPRRATVYLEESLRLFRERGSRLGCATVLFGLGWSAYMQDEIEAAVARNEESLALYRELNQPLGTAAVLVNLGIAEYERGNHARALALLEESLALFHSAGDRRGAAWVLLDLGMVARDDGDRARARASFDESLALCRELADVSGIARGHQSLGSLALLDGDLVEAGRLYRRALATHWETGDRRSMTYCIESLARVAAAEGRPERALRLAAAGLTLRESRGTVWSAAAQRAMDGIVAAARRESGEAAEAAWAAGRSLTLREAVAEALAAEAPRSPVSGASP
jgi:predicted ATPase/DNA-binding SARP family transcriptional activator